MRRALLAQFDQYVKLNKKIPPEILTSMSGIDDGGRLADAIAAHLPLKLEQKQQILEMSEVGKRLEHLLGVLEGEVDILQVEKRIRGRVKRQMEKSQREYYLNEQVKAIQKELGEGDENADLEEMEKKIKAAKMSKEAEAKAMAELKKLKMMSPMSAEATVVRNYIDTLHGAAVAQEEQDQQGPRARGQDPRRRPLRPREGQGTHRRVPRGAAARRQAEGADPVPRRPARRGQDVARPIGRQGHRPQVRPDVAGRRARRGRDPRPSPHVHRLDARQDPAEHDEGRRAQSAVPARRSRQDGAGLPRRSVVGAARGARSGAERHVRRPLRRGRVRPVRRDVRRDGQHDEHPGAAARPDGSHPPVRLHRGREDRDRQAVPDAQADEEQRHQARRAARRRKRAARHRALLHARGRRAQPRARHQQDLPQGREGAAAQAERGQGAQGQEPGRHQLEEPRQVSRRAPLHVRHRREARTRSARSPALRGPKSAATC